MSRPSRGERLAAKGRPKRLAAKTHFFKYQLASNPSRVEENDLKRALQESLEEQDSKKKGSKRISSTNSSDVSRSNNSSSSNESMRSPISSTLKRTRSSTLSLNFPVNKRAKVDVSNGNQDNCDGNTSVTSRSPPISTPQFDRILRTYSRIQSDSSVQKQKRPSEGLKTSIPIIKPVPNSPIQNNEDVRSRSSSQTSASKSTQTVDITGKLCLVLATTKVDTTATSPSITKFLNNKTSGDTPIQDPYLKLKRESKNYAYVKMTALHVNTLKSPSGNSRSSNSKKSSPSANSPSGLSQRDSTKANSRVNHSHNNSASSSSPPGSSKNTKQQSTKDESEHDNKTTSKYDSNLGKKSPSDISPKTSQSGKASETKVTKSPKNVQNTVEGKSSNSKQGFEANDNAYDTRNDCFHEDTEDLSDTTDQNQADVKVIKEHSPQGSWSLLGVPEEKVIYLRDDEPPRRLICYPAIKHVEGDVIQVRDSVLLRSGARKTDLPFIAKVCAFWEDSETNGVMMSLFWYYRPEHTEEGRKAHHLPDEIFASRHRDVDSVECIEDKCYVLTFNEYCRYRKRCKMEQVNTTWSLTDVTIPLSNESYPRRSRIPDSDVNPELVFCCRQIYDSRLKRLLKNPLINPKYGHI